LRIFTRVLGLVISLTLIGLALPTAAQQDQTGSGLSISPTISEFTIDPGGSDTVDITLKNITVADIVAQAYLNDFSADNQSGSPRIITDTSQQSPNSIKNFVVGLADVPLAKGEQKKLTIPLQIPAGTTPGAYYGIIRYKAVPAAANAPEEGEVALSASVGTIVLITVPGTITEQVELSAIRVYRGENQGSFFTNPPTDIGVEIKNLGTGFIKPYGTVEVRDMFGNETYTYQLNNTAPRANILPDSSRIFKDPLKNVSKIGRYTVTASVTYGSGSDVLVAKKTFWYVPGWLVFVVMAGLALIIWAVLKAYRRWRRGSKAAYKKGRP
jgi:hypothetical protein